MVSLYFATVELKRCDTVSGARSCWDGHKAPIICPDCPFDLHPGSFLDLR